MELNKSPRGLWRRGSCCGKTYRHQRCVPRRSTVQNRLVPHSPWSEIRVAAAGNVGGGWPLGHLEATGDLRHSSSLFPSLCGPKPILVYTITPDSSTNSWSDALAVPAEQIREDPDRCRSKYSNQSVESCTKLQRCRDAANLQLMFRNHTAGLCSHVGQAV